MMINIGGNCEILLPVNDIKNCRLQGGSSSSEPLQPLTERSQVQHNIRSLVHKQHWILEYHLIDLLQWVTEMMGIQIHFSFICCHSQQHWWTSRLPDYCMAFKCENLDWANLSQQMTCWKADRLWNWPELRFYAAVKVVLWAKSAMTIY